MLNPYATDLLAEMDDPEPGACPRCHYKGAELVYALGRAVSCTSCVLGRVAASSAGFDKFKAWADDFAQKKRNEREGKK